MKFRHTATLIKNKRLHHPVGYTQVEVGCLLGLKEVSGMTVISNIERRIYAPPSKHCLKMCQILNIDVEELKQAFINDKLEHLDRAMDKWPN